MYDFGGNDMFTAIRFENYMSLKQLELNIKKKDSPKKIVAIYGENGSGKSNIISALTNLNLSLLTLRNQNFITDTNENLSSSESDIGDYTARKKQVDLMLRAFQSRKYAKILSLFSDSYMLETEEPMKIKYEFQIDGHNGYYELIFKKNNGRVYLAKEKLNFLINKSSGMLFEINSNNEGEIVTKFSPSLFKADDTKTVMESNIARFWGKHTFFAIFDDFEDSNNYSYILENISHNFLRVINNFRKISFRTDDAMGSVQVAQVLSELVKGSIYKNESLKIDKTEKALMKYFVPLYSDIEEIFYKRSSSEDEIDYELYEKKRINNELITIPFKFESNGTKKLLNLFPLFLNAISGQTVIIDEIDQGIHDLLIERLIDNIQEDLKGQLIFTTHDTQIMQQLDVSCLYVLQIDSVGNKKIINLSKASQKNIATNNNIQKLYLNGYFSGIPYVDDVDFGDILEYLGGNE
ncbi:AAA family ATPase [Latilactobacillus sakei]|uniref:AAA family ATPase n=1 Tax=Latilactobacillus sakei TaxID=1599 RepID=UPI0020736926|nr:AAA family ATPase [Latilactobacillus sakei]